MACRHSTKFTFLTMRSRLLRPSRLGSLLIKGTASTFECNPHPDRFHRLPDSAIELVDEACSYAKIGTDPSWDKLGKWRRLQVAKEIHLKSLQV